MGNQQNFLAAVLLVFTTVAHVKSDDDIVIFNAVRNTSFGPISRDTIIPFDIVTLNIGGAYDPATGLFTTPVDGIFEISWSVKSREAVWSHLRVNDRDEGQIGTAPERTASATRMLDLKKGDQVGAQLYYDRGTYGKTLSCNLHRACGFNGRLLYVHSYNLLAPGSDD